MKEQLMNYLVTSTGALTIQDVLLNFLVAAVVGVVIFLSYRISHAGAAYSARFNVSLVMLTLVTTLVMNVIGNNIALSLGMVGALSIVRFRTAIKDPRDTAYIFWCIAVGICCGVSEYLIAGVGTAVIFGMMLIFGFVQNNERYLIIFRGGKECREKLETLVDERFQGKARLVVHNTTQDTTEYIYEISQKQLKLAKKSGNIVDFFQSNLKLDAINIVCQNDEINR
ncbi:MAG: DUF4956 domain-containing protein [Lachnospiraceae bacterium]|nr:DUF4956 domain-containing protein [Lachnospiraceae bacterium]